MAHCDSVRADQTHEKMTSDKCVILQAQSMKITQNSNFNCIFAVCALTLAFLKVSIRVCGVCMEHIACHLGHFTPLRNAIQSICQRSFFQFVGLLCVQYIAPWDSGNSATMSLRNLHVHYGGSYVPHNIAIYIAHRRNMIYEGRG